MMLKVKFIYLIVYLYFQFSLNRYNLLHHIFQFIKLIFIYLFIFFWGSQFTIH